MSRYYNGPVSDHFNGERFFDSRGVPPKGRGDLLRWLFGRGRTRAKWPKWAPRPTAIVRRPASTARPYVSPISVMPAFWCKVPGSMCCSIRCGRSAHRLCGLSVRRRVNDPGIAFADLPSIDAGPVSHALLRSPRRRHLVFGLTPRTARTSLLRSAMTPSCAITIAAIAAEAYDWGERIDLGAGVAVTTGPNTTLVGAKLVRPQHVAVGIVRH